MKLEVGMYVRNCYGRIAKIEYIEDNIAYCDNWLYQSYEDHITFINLNDEEDNNEILKASYNIIDLISRFDLVNGHLVICKMYENEKDIPTIIKCVGDYYFKEEDIKSVITHEQMEQMTYKVGE